jgi:hypothetical protein
VLLVPQKNTRFHNHYPMFNQILEQHSTKLNRSLMRVYGIGLLFCPVSTCMFVARMLAEICIIVDSCCSDDGGFIY